MLGRESPINLKKNTLNFFKKYQIQAGKKKNYKKKW